MRDILTVIAGLVILVLAAALVAPPLIEWEAYRGTIDRAIAQATGTAAHTNGRIEVRLLPSPRVRFDAIRIGGATPQEATLDARFVKAELALSPLLTGDVRFTQARIGRAEVRVPTGRTGDWRVPADLLGICDALFTEFVAVVVGVPAQLDVSHGHILPVKRSPSRACRSAGTRECHWAATLP